ncbi:hypothetical protein E2651_33660 [Streptomyces sp. MZ04]|nr:hypothetical protein E2651_33660 [Streptomyces sp. MZ04]
MPRGRCRLQLHGHADTPRRLKDPTTKLDLAPGRHRLGGGEALQYVRSRHVDTAADFGRIQRQRHFLVAALSSLRTENVLGDPARAAQLSRTLLGVSKVDQGFNGEELLSLASELSEIPPRPWSSRPCRSTASTTR